MQIDDHNGLATYLMDRIEDLWRQAASTGRGDALIAEAQELLALRANIVRRRRLAEIAVQLQLPFEQAA